MTTGTRLAIRRLAERHPELTQACVSRVLGVSRERVRQIVSDEGLRFRPHRQPNTLIDWSCPGCGGRVEMWTKVRQARRTAYCRRCSHMNFTCHMCGAERTSTERATKWHRGLCRRCNAISAREGQGRLRRAAGIPERPGVGPKRKYL